MAFSRILGTGDKDLQKKADELLLELSKGLQSASAKLCVATDDWEDGNVNVLKELEHEIIKLERDMDAIKEELVENVLTKSAFMPQASLERHTLAKDLDKVIDAAEDAIRIIIMGHKMKPPKEIRKIGKKIWKCTDLLQNAVKYLYDDFKKAIELTRELDMKREEARDVQFELLGKLYSNPDFHPNEIVFFQTVSERMVLVAQRSEDAGDYIRELAVKYS